MTPDKKLAMRLALKEMQDMAGEFIDFCHTAAKALYNYYVALVDKGFTPSEALRIVIAHGMNPGGPTKGE